MTWAGSGCDQGPVAAQVEAVQTASVIRLLAPVAIGLVFLVSALPTTAVAKDGGGEVRVDGVCGSGATSKLRLKSSDNRIELRFEVDHRRARVVWRVVIVQERRIAWKGPVRTTRPDGSFEVRRTLQDLPGADAVTARALGPHGLVCRAAAILRDS